MENEELVKKNRVFKYLLSIEKFILVTTSLLAAGIVAVGVFTRYILGIDFFGQEEIITVIAMWLYWIGGIYGSYEDSHIQADLLSSYVKNKKFLKIQRILVLLITIIVLAVFSYWSFDYIKWSIGSNAKSVGLKIPLIISQIPLCVGFTMMLGYTVYHFIRQLIPSQKLD